jgi:hypothetical protein
VHVAFVDGERIHLVYGDSCDSHDQSGGGGVVVRTSALVIEAPAEAADAELAIGEHTFHIGIERERKCCWLVMRSSKE